jgi:hypothetical protein
MTKFGEYGNIGLTGFLFWNIRFWQLQDKNKKGAKLEDLHIQGILRHGKGLRSIKESRWKKSKPKVEAAKIRLSGLGYRSI